MPPKRTIHIDRLAILRAIRAQAIEQQAETRALADGRRWPEHYVERLLAEDEFVPRDLRALTGKQLTPSERIRAQQSMREMEAAGLIELRTVHVKLLPPGLALIEEVPPC